MSMQTKTF